MVIVHTTTRDHATAWRVRDALAAHPFLAGACVYIRISASPNGILLEGWVQDERTRQLALRLARCSVGQRAVRCALQTQPANTKLAQRKLDDNAAQAPN